MPFNFNKIKDSLQDGAQFLVHKSKKLTEISSLNLKILSLENKIKELYKELGEEFYNQYKEGKGENNRIMKLCKEVDENRKGISELRKKIETIKDKE